MIRNCIVCGKEFDTTTEGRRKYCSFECCYTRHLANKRQNYRLKTKANITATCPVCGKNFTKTHYNKIFCSDKCRYENQLASETIRREKRGKDYYKSPTNSKKEKALSDKPKIAKAKKAAEQSHKLRMQRQAEAKKLGLTYGQYLARKGLQEL